MMEQLSLLDRAHKPLVGQAQRVFTAIRDGRWRTLWQIQAEIKRMTGYHDSETGVSARLRQFRNPLYGGFTVESRQNEDRHWVYRLQA